MKKILAIIMAMLLLLAAVGCNNGNGNDTDPAGNVKKGVEKLA